MSETQSKETRGFETEARKLLKLMIHSLYSDREIFLRELVSNAADACDRLRFESLADPALAAGAGEPGIWIDVDADARSLTVRDNGIGMTREEMIAHLGTIARSGTAEFIGRLSEAEQRDARLIGQFGVGFYSAFMVADRVEVTSRRAGTDASAGARWTSAGESEYDIEHVDVDAPGTSVRMLLKADAGEYLEDYRLRALIRRYSDHISVPVHLRRDGKSDGAWEVVNQAKALWTRPRSELTDDEYKAFYRHVSHDFDEPRTWSHNRVEGRLEYTSLLYIPKHAPFDLWQREAPRGLKLYVQRVFIMDDAERFLPLYLRFVKGVVDCADLPLNVSRELLQKDERVDTIRQALTRRVLDMLKKLASDDAAGYAEFWHEFGRVLKEAPAEDFANREEVARLLRFASTKGDGEKPSVSLADYVARMLPGQDRIYYVCADNFATAAGSPHLEALARRGIEVLLCTDRIDDWLMTTLGEFDGRKLADVARGDLDLGKVEAAEPAQAAADAVVADVPALVERVRAALGDAVAGVRASERLVDSPSCLVVGADEMGQQMRRLLQAAGQKAPESKPTLELNPRHALVRRLADEVDEDRFGDLAGVLLDQAQLAGGGQLDDPARFVRRLNRLLLDVAART
jgi:molecular chaperone HtpG